MTEATEGAAKLLPPPPVLALTSWGCRPNAPADRWNSRAACLLVSAPSHRRNCDIKARHPGYDLSLPVSHGGSTSTIGRAISKVRAVCQHAGGRGSPR